MDYYSEIDDYNQEHFFELENYQSIIDSWEEPYIEDNWAEPTPQDKDIAYNVFTLEQAINVIKELEKSLDNLSVSANTAIIGIEDFMKQYTKLYSKAIV